MDEQKAETRTLADSSQLSGGITFGIRGCLSTLAGSILGAMVGTGLTVLLTVGPGYNWVEDGIALMLAFGGGVLGFVFGALLGVIVGTKRR